MPGLVNVDNAGIHSPSFKEYNTIDSYKKIAKHGSKLITPSFSFATSKRKMDLSGVSGKKAGMMPGPGAYNLQLNEMA